MRDPLTGAFNRRWLAARGRPRKDVVVILLDLDGLRRVNDRRGYAAGDRCLISVARAIRTALGPSRPLVRLGGDEFLVPWTGSVSEARLVAAAAVAAAGARRTPVRVSAGVATVRPGAAPRGWTTLVEAAHRALRRAKSAGGGQVRWSWA